FVGGAWFYSISPSVTGVYPFPNSLAVGDATPVQATFSGPIDPLTLTDAAFSVTGMKSGKHTGSLLTGSGDSAVTFIPAIPFQKGEVVVVNVSQGVRDPRGASVVPRMWMFTVGSDSSTGIFAP